MSTRHLLSKAVLIKIEFASLRAVQLLLLSLGRLFTCWYIEIKDIITKTIVFLIVQQLIQSRSWLQRIEKPS